MLINDEIMEHLSPFGVYFNNIDLTQYFFPKQDKGRGLPDREVSEIIVPGRAGSYITGTRTPTRYISQEIVIACDDAQELRKKLEELSELLHTDKPAPLRFEDEMDRTYFAIFAGATEGYELHGFHTATINFICSDPYKYGPSKVLNFTDGQATVHNFGTVANSPTIKATVLSDITYMDVFTDYGYMRIGQPVETEEIEYNPREKIWNEQFATVTGWTSAGTSIDGGTVAGNMQSNGYLFYANDYGVPNGTVWYGPALKTSVPNGPIADFEAEWKITFTNPSSDTRGRMEMYLLDDQSTVIAKVAMKRVGGGAGGNVVEIRIGTASAFHFYVSYAGDRGIEWKNFKGMLRLSRKDNVWQAYVAMIDDDGRHHTRHSPKAYIDTEYLYTQALAQVQIHIGRSSADVSLMRSDHLNVYQLFSEPDKIPVIATTDDLIELNFKESLISINGEPRPDLKDFGATFFKLKKGKNTLLAEPAQSLDAEIEIQEVFL